MSRKSGYFICYRNIWQHPVFTNLLQASCWIYMISSASHQDKNLRFLENTIFVRRGMITTRVAHLQPTSNHKNRKVTIINVINYDKFQYVDNQQSHTDHISQQGLNKHTNKQLLNIGSSKDKVVNSGYKTVGDWGQHTILEKDGKRYLKHKWKNEPLKEYK